MIELQNVSKSYGGHQTIFDGVSFSLKPAEFLYVLGSSGAGKSTLLRVLAGFEHVTAGKVAWYGYRNDQVTESQSRKIRQKLAWIPQKNDLIPELTVADNLKIAAVADPSVLPQSDEVCRDVIEQLQLSDRLNHEVRKLSGGEAQRAIIARALFRKSSFILADEPTGAQDMDLTWRIMDLLVKQQLKGTTVVLATHDLEIVRRLRKRCAVLKDGKFSIEGGQV